MSLSKKNLDKLNKFKTNKNLNNESNNISSYTNISNNDDLISNPYFLYFTNSINC